MTEKESQMGSRRHFTAEFKAKLALEALKGQQTINEIASHHSVHPNQIVLWKKQLLAEARNLFGDKRLKQDEEQQELTDRLYQQIGQLKVELDWLKKKSGLGS
jgi:transposase-like protein